MIPLYMYVIIWMIKIITELRQRPSNYPTKYQNWDNSANIGPVLAQ